jgi:hypothetical protein
MCANEAVARFRYRSLNGASPVEEPLCGVCAKLLDRVGTVKSLELAAEADDEPETLSLLTLFDASRSAEADDSVEAD